MLSPVNILLCVNPLASSTTVDEGVLFRLADRVAPVLNITILSRDGSIKAFLQFCDEPSALRAIESLDGALLSIGRLSAFRSHKSFISYGRSPEEARWMFGERDGERPFGNDPRNTEIGDKNNRFIQTNFFKKGASLTLKPRILDKIISNEENESSFISSSDNHAGQGSGTHSPSQLHGITVTHSDPEYLHIKMIKRLFRRYGRIFDLSFDSEHQAWTVQFGTKKSAKKIAKRISLNKMFGYTVFGGNIGVSPVLLTKPTMTTASHEPSLQELEQCAPEMVQPSSDSPPCAYLRVNNTNDAELGRIIKAVSILHTPLTVVFGFDGRTRSYCCFVGFRYIFQAAETFVSVARGEFGLNCQLQLTSSIDN